MHQNDEMRNVLVVTYNFPPVGRSPVMRVLKFVKYLPEYGWRSIVLTTKGYTSQFDIRDDSLCREIPASTRIYRTISIDPTSIVYYASSLFSGRSPGKTVNPARGSTTSEHASESLFSRISAFVRSIVLIPDENIFWMPFALIRSFAIFTQEDIRAIFATAPPYSNMIIAYLLKAVYHRPLILDYRDRWFNNPLTRPRFRWRLKIEGWLEEKILRSADTVICVSKEMVDEYGTLFPAVGRDKFRVIHNGFDSSDLEVLSEASDAGSFRMISQGSEDKFILTYTGGLFLPQQFPAHFFEAVRQLVEEDAELKNRLQVWIVGPYADTLSNPLRDLPVKFVGMVPHAEVMTYLINSDVLLLLLFNNQDVNVIYHSKLFEYMATGKPVLAMVPEGSAARFVTENNLGIVVPPENIGLIKEAIRKLYQDYRAGKPDHVNRELLRQFERKNLTQLLARALSENCPDTAPC